MALKIILLELKNFRNFSQYSLIPGERINIVVGDNAVGKTNIIEALQLMTMAASFRKPRWSDVVRWEEEKAYISMVATGDARRIDVEARFEGGKRSYSLNGKSCGAFRICGEVPSVLFTPEDLSLVKGSAGRRRDAVDMVGSQISHVYQKIKSDYEKVVLQRNRLLKDEFVDKALLMSWTESLVSIGSLFFKHRFNLFEMLAGEFDEITKVLIPDISVSIAYYSSLDAYGHTQGEYEECFHEVITGLYNREMQARMTLAGPHRDDIRFLVDGRDARSFASQGQQRIIALAFKLAEVRVIAHLHEQMPILLLDDVMSELDRHRREGLLSYVVDENIQTFITSAHIDYFPKDILDSSHLIHL